MKITRNDILTIAKKPYKLNDGGSIDDIDYLTWVSFIDAHQKYFTWYEETPDGKDALQNLHNVPEWAKERVLYTLSKKRVYTTEELVSSPTDLVVTYSESDKRVTVSLDKNLTGKAAKLILSMARHLDALLLKNGIEPIDDRVIEKLV